jgi:methylenetetrahydrofolate dehydrogenase (NADP+) / methenyltetrahydrofolate cyclohydrolase
MEMSGEKLAEPILEEVKKRVLRLAEKNTIPELSIITVGGEDAWYSYVAQKIKTAERLGIKTRLIHLDGKNEQDLLKVIQGLNDDKNIHGIIVQRPIPKIFNRDKIVSAINPIKDIDGFRSDSIYNVPVVLAVEDFIKEAYGVIIASDLQKILLNQSICVVGKGETAGGPIKKWLYSKRAVPTIIDTRTENPCQVLKKTDLIISASGKKDMIKPECIKEGTVLIGVGTRREDGKLKGDYEVEQIKGVAKAYTPTPGGVGPLNLAYLFQNLLAAAEKQT